MFFNFRFYLNTLFVLTFVLGLFFICSNMICAQKAQIPFPLEKATILRKINSNIPFPEQNILKKPLRGQAFSSGPTKITKHNSKNWHAYLLQKTLVRQPITQIKNGLDALHKGHIARAIAIRNQMEQNSLDRDILTWSIGLTYDKNISYEEYDYALKNSKNWPNQLRILKNREIAFIERKRTDTQVLNFFSNAPPQTTKGYIALTLAKWHLAKQQKISLKQLQKDFSFWWHSAALSKKQEDYIFKNLKFLLTPKDAFIRMETLLLQRKFSAAKRIAKRIHAESLYHVYYAALHHYNRTTQKCLDNIEKRWGKTLSFRYAKINFLRHRKQPERAAKILFDIPKDAQKLLYPKVWWTEQRVLSRELLDLGKNQEAYTLVKDYPHSDAEITTEAEFHAGWYALRFLNAPLLALNHFENLIKASSRPLTCARGFYWLGRTYETLKNFDKAHFYFKKSARYGTSFYGQLSSAKLNQKAPLLYTPNPNEKDTETFLQREPVKAIQRLEQVGYHNTAKLLYRQLGQELFNPKEIAILTHMIENMGDYFTSLKIGKDATIRGLNIGTLSHPIGALPVPKDISAKEEALAYAIARQESEFNLQAHSHAGARGMLQIMPRTAHKIARKNKINYSKHKLIHDPAYNTKLSLYYLQEQLENFSHSYILTFIAYNAGAQRASDWIKRYGDPRLTSLEYVIDWIERIPFPETRNYVMRVMENYEIYQTLLLNRANIEEDLQISEKS